MPPPNSSALAEQCSVLQIRGPLLVVAVSRTVSELALSWEATLQSLDIPYRVFVFSEHSSYEINEILTEAIDVQRLSPLSGINAFSTSQKKLLLMLTYHW